MVMSQQGCFRCKNRTGLSCPHCPLRNNLATLAKTEKDLGTPIFDDNHEEYFIGAMCESFTPKTAVPIVVIYNGEIIFERKN